MFVVASKDSARQNWFFWFIAELNKNDEGCCLVTRDSSSPFIGTGLRPLTEDDLLRAAEEVVKAASYYGSLRGKTVLTESQRRVLVQAVFTDPTITELLFKDGGIIF